MKDFNLSHQDYAVFLAADAATENMAFMTILLMVTLRLAVLRKGMVIFMPYFLAITPQERSALPACPLPLVLVAYQISASGCLCCSAAENVADGALMGLSDCCPGVLPQQDRLLRAMVQECEKRNFSGIFADLEPPYAPDRIVFFDKLGEALRTNGKKLYTPLSLPVPSATLLVNTALSGGSLFELLKQYQKRYGSRLALDLERLRMDFTLPCPTGREKPLSAEELASLRKKYGMSVFFSRELCAHYFTYSLGSETHFVVFDDAETFCGKLSLARTLGIDTGFFMYPEVKDILPQLHECCK